MEITGERQVAPTLDGIRRDHVARYEWAAKQIPQGSRVVDMACGVGYGTQILADAGFKTTGYDKSEEAIAYARQFYPRADYRVSDGICLLRLFDVAVCFETIEHIEHPAELLRSFHGARVLLASVPNEDVFPYRNYAFHYRHYTRDEFADLLHDSGWKVREWWGQLDDESEVERDVNGRTLIAVCDRIDPEVPKYVEPEPVAKVEPPKDEPGSDYPVPEHVTILGLGPSLEKYVDIAKRLGGKHAYCDETWGINAVAGVVMCDRVFHMDDVRIQQLRSDALPESNIARMLEWVKVHPGPIYTSRTHEDYPGLVAYPLEAVLNSFPHATGYFNGTAAYAVAYAIHIGVRKISLFGIDFTLPNSHHAERGRACVEYWLGVASERGIELRIPKESSLMDAMYPQAGRFYGYDTLDLTIRSEHGKARIDFVPKDRIPTADEMERRYDHSRPVNHEMQVSQR